MERGTHGERVRLRPRETLALLGFRGVADQFDLVQPVWVLSVVAGREFLEGWMDAAASATLRITLLE